MLKTGTTVCELCGKPGSGEMVYNSLTGTAHAECHDQAMGAIRTCPNGCHESAPLFLQIFRERGTLRCTRCGAEVPAKAYFQNYLKVVNRGKENSSG